jgi:hypothetical protein
MRGWISRLQFLLVLAGVDILEHESRWAHDHILLSQVRVSHNLEGQVPVFISPRNRVAQLYPQAVGSCFVASYDSQGYGRGVRNCLLRGYLLTTVLCYGRRSVGQSWNKAPVWGLRPDFYACQTIAGLLMWGALSDESMGLSFTIAPGPRQCSHFRVHI